MTIESLLTPAEINELEMIAHDYADIETLTTRNSDDLDFREMAVWTIRDLMARAFAAGKAAR
jgi:hypothetical protein